MDFAETKRRKDATTDVLCLGWWATGGSLTSKSGLERAMSTLAAVLPEALPSRWDIDETYRHRIVDDGLKGLVEFVDAHRSWVCLRAKAPARSVQVFAVPPSQRRGEFRSTCLLVELDISVLGRRGAGKRLPGAFEQLAEVIEPFYAEARVMRGVAKHEGATARYEPGVECYPFQSNAWWGLPLKAPFAAVLGNPYRQHWPGFGTSEQDGLAIENPRPWDRDVAGLAWHVPAGLCQQFDPHMAQVQPPGGIGNFVAFQLMVPTVRAAVWPLEEPPEHVARPLAEPLVEKASDGEIRRVAVDDEDGETFEAWQRTTTTADMRSVWARKTALTDWTWEVTVGALEFVRDDPLEDRLRGALRAALQAVAGVTAVSEEDRETLLVAGAPAGRQIMGALTRVVDGMADELRRYYEAL